MPAASQKLPQPEPEPELHSLPRPTVREFYRDHAAFVGRCLRYMGVAEAELEDAVQEVFMVVHRRLEDFQPGTSARSWLYAMCIRIGRAHRRKAAKHRERISALPPPPAATPQMSGPSEQLHRRQVALRLLDALDDDKRAVFVLYHVEQMSMPEVARALGCPLQTAYSRLKSAQKKLTLIVSNSRPKGEL